MCLQVTFIEQSQKCKGKVNVESSVRRWCQKCNAGRKNVHDEEKSVRPRVITDNLILLTVQI